jgi:hypothetical protein
MPGSAWQRVLAWMMAPAPMDATAPPTRLHEVQEDFMAALADAGHGDAEALRQRVLQAGTLRDLWHARAEVYRAVGLAHSEAEAERRLTQVCQLSAVFAVSPAANPHGYSLSGQK